MGARCALWHPSPETTRGTRSEGRNLRLRLPGEGVAQGALDLRLLLWDGGRMNDNECAYCGGPACKTGQWDGQTYTPCFSDCCGKHGDGCATTGAIKEAEK